MKNDILLFVVLVLLLLLLLLLLSCSSHHNKRTIKWILPSQCRLASRHHRVQSLVLSRLTDHRRTRKILKRKEGKLVRLASWKETQPIYTSFKLERYVRANTSQSTRAFIFSRLFRHQSARVDCTCALERHLAVSWCVSPLSWVGSTLGVPRQMEYNAGSRNPNGAKKSKDSSQ